ncbi:MAG: signal peptide peptidase SppA [Proteobacteria bacterium]|nr:signal peptide peptidase SppA [Pseudomonadota bacterium]
MTTDQSTPAPPRRFGVRLLVRLGVFAVLLLLILSLWSPDDGPEVQAGSTLVLPISGSYVESADGGLFGRLLGDTGTPFLSVLSTLALAERDSRIEAVVLRVRSSDLGWGKIQELRDVITRLRASGKRMVVYLETESFSANKELYLASAADQVLMAPGALAPLNGLAAEYLFLGGLWEKLGVSFEVERIGRFKSAPESLTGREMSEASREMANSLLDSLYGQFVAGLAQGRGLTEEEVRTVIDAAPVTGEQLMAEGLIDGVTPLEDWLETEEATRIEAREYRYVDPAELGFAPAARVALIYGAGTVVTGDGTHSTSGEPVFASDTVSRAIREAAEAPGIAGIILRLDSPGGSPLASEIIWDAMQRARAKGVPVVVSMSDMAASGGYYVAAGADAVVAPPGAYTGSIGVFVMRPVLRELLEKLGVGTEALVRGEQAEFVLASAPLSEAGRERLRGMVEDIYRQFLERVSEGRDLAVDEVDALARGRVYTGAQAADLGLVDELGGLRTAVDRMKGVLSLGPDDDVELVVYPAPQSLADQVLELLGTRRAHFELPASLVPDGLENLARWLLALPERQPLLVPPVWVDVR